MGTLSDMCVMDWHQPCKIAIKHFRQEHPWYVAGANAFTVMCFQTACSYFGKRLEYYEAQSILIESPRITQIDKHHWEYERYLICA